MKIEFDFDRLLPLYRQQPNLAWPNLAIEKLLTWLRAGRLKDKRKTFFDWVEIEFCLLTLDWDIECWQCVAWWWLQANFKGKESASLKSNTVLIKNTQPCHVLQQFSHSPHCRLYYSYLSLTGLPPVHVQWQQPPVVVAGNIIMKYWTARKWHTHVSVRQRKRILKQARNSAIARC